MPVFAYRARNSAGEPESGEVAAGDRAEALAILHDRGLHVSALTPLAPTPARAPAPAPGVGSLFLRVPLMNRAAFWRQAAQSQEAGLTLGRTLQMLAEAHHGPLSAFCRRHAPAVQDGSRLSEAMAAEPGLFSPLEVGLVRAGEASGRLDVHLRSLAEVAESELELRNSVRARIWYLGCIGTVFLITAFVVSVVAPTIQARLMGQEVSLATRVSQFALPLLLVAAVLLGWRVVYAGSGTVRLAVDRVKLSLPVLGGVLRKLAIARFCRAMSHLVAAGVALGEAIEIGAYSTGNQHLARKLLALPPRVRAGTPLSDALESTGDFPVPVIQMVRTGEETGKTDESLAKMSDYYEGEAKSATAVLVTLSFVGIMLLVGIVVGVFVVGFYARMYGSALELLQ